MESLQPHEAFSRSDTENNNANEAQTSQDVFTTPVGATKSQQKKSHVGFYAGGLLLVLLLGAGAYFAWGYMPFAGNVEEEEKFVIGGILPLTGDAASFGVPIKQAAELAVKELNAQGGIDSRQVVIEWRDGRCEGEDARAAAEQLLVQVEPDLMISGACSGEFLAAAPIVQAQGIISLTPSATSPDISNLGNFVFRTAPSDALAGAIAAKYARTTFEAQRVAVISEDKAYTKGLHDVFVASFVDLGGEVVVDRTYQTGESNFTEIVSEVALANVDVVYILPQSPTPGVLIVKALKDAEVGAKLLTAEVLLIRDAVVEQGDILEGVTGIEVYFDESRPKTQAMVQAYENEYNLEAIYPGFMTGMYDMLYMMRDAYQNTDGSALEVSEYLYNIAWDGSVGEIKFSRRGDPTAVYSARTILNKEAPIVDVIETVDAP